MYVHLHLHASYDSQIQGLHLHEHDTNQLSLSLTTTCTCINMDYFHMLDLSVRFKSEKKRRTCVITGQSPVMVAQGKYCIFAYHKAYILSMCRIAVI